jgi:hypothetical protein
MNVRLKKKFSWASGLVYDNRFCVNQYDVILNMLTVSSDHEQQNIAYDRMKVWINRFMDDSIMIHDQSEELDLFRKINGRVMVLPEEPVDQVVGIMLYLKLNAVMQNRIVVTDVEVSSKQGDHTSYIHSHGEALGALSTDGWWVDPRPTWYQQHVLNEDVKVVTLDRVPEWKDFDLDWEDNDRSDRDSVVFADFNRDEKK